MITTQFSYLIQLFVLIMPWNIKTLFFFSFLDNMTQLSSVLALAFPNKMVDQNENTVILQVLFVLNLFLHFVLKSSWARLQLPLFMSFLLNPHEHIKLEPHACLCCFLRYGIEDKGQHYWALITRRLYISKHVTFWENTMLLYLNLIVISLLPNLSLLTLLSSYFLVLRSLFILLPQHLILLNLIHLMIPFLLFVLLVR